MNVIGLEVSTSAAKCMLFSSEDGLVDSVEVPFSSSVTDKITQDPDAVVAVALKALKLIAGRSSSEIAAIGLVGTWHSLLLLDAEERPLGPISMWADLSAAPTVAELRRDQALVRDCYQKTGCMVHAMYPAYKYYHMQRAEPERAKQVRFVSSQVEYLYQALTGDRAASRCTASGTGLLNIYSLDWDDEMLALVGLRRGQLSELHEVFHWSGLRSTVAREVGLKAGTPVTVGGADGAMNQVAIGGAKQGIMSFSVGTSGAVRMAVDAPKLPEQPATWCYYLYNGQRLAGAATNGATNCVDWYLNRCGGTLCSYEDFDQAASTVDAADAPIFLPFIYGERCPGWDENRPGGFMGVRAQHGQAELYYAILEGVLFNLYQCYLILTETAGEPDRILISGGIMNSRFWLQMACDLLGRELWSTGAKNDSTLGAALVALASVNGAVDVEGVISPKMVCSPASPAKTELYRRRFEKYLELYRASAGLM